MSVSGIGTLKNTSEVNVGVESDHCPTVNSCLKLKGKPGEVNGVLLEVYSWWRRLEWRNDGGPRTEGLLPSSSSLAVGASKQIMLGGCLALRRSFWASCKSRRSFVVSSSFCWKCRASVTERQHTCCLILPLGSSSYLVVTPPVLGYTY